MRDSIHRLLTLRQYPGFADAELEELAVIAENVVDMTLPAGSIAAPSGRVPSLLLVVEGRIETATATYGPREVFGSLEVIAGRALKSPAVAVLPTRVLQLGPADFANLLEDNFGLLTNVRRTLARELLAEIPALLEAQEAGARIGARGIDPGMSAIT